MLNRPRALFVCAHLPSADAAQAGHKTAFTNLVELATTHEVDVLVACRTADLTSSAAAQNHLRPIAQRVQIVSLSRLRGVLSMLQGMAHGLAPRLATRYGDALGGPFRAWLDQKTYEIVWLEFTQVFWLATLAAGRTSRLIFSVHDVLTQLVSTKSRLEANMLLGWTFTTERRLFQYATAIRVLSQKDASLLTTFLGCNPRRLEIRSVTLSTFVAGVRRNADVIEAFSILFWGAMSRVENHGAALWFAESVFPRLLAEFPAARLYVVGSNPPAKLRALASNSIVVTGFVDDPTSYFERCAIGIAPLASGAGIKVKVLEMLEAGIPVISTRVGAEGIGAQPLLTVASLDRFEAAVAGHWRTADLP